jgi:tetratricopeptide (TPR) repeat protein
VFRTPLRAFVTACLLCTPATANQHLDRARAALAAGDTDAALAAWAEVTAADGATEADIATARNNACVVHSDRGELEIALAECTEALALRERLGDDRRTARTLNNLALVLQRRGELDPAGDRYRQALELNLALDDAEAAVINLQNLAIVAGDRAAYRDALTLLERARALIAAHPGAPWTETQTAVADLNRGAFLDKLGAHREALGLYRDLVTRATALGPSGRATLELNVGVMERNLGDPNRAQTAFESAAALFLELGEAAGLALARLNLAVLHDIDRGDAAAARAAYTGALDASRAAGEAATAGHARALLGDFLLRQGEAGRAEEISRECLAGDRALAEVYWACQALAGRLAVAHGDTEDALRHFDAAVTTIESIRGALDQRGYRSGFFTDKIAVYREAVAVALDLGRAETALDLVWRAKARELVEAIGADRSPSTTAVSPTSVGAALRPGEILLELFQVGNDLVRFRLEPGGTLEVDRQPAPQLAATAARWRREVLAGRVTPEATAELSRMLFGGLDLAAFPLFIAPDGGLAELPFDLLHTDRGPLADTLVWQLVPSGAMLRVSRPAHPPTRMLVAVADPLLGAELALPALPNARAEVDSAAAHLGGDHTILLGPAATASAILEAAEAGARVLHFAAHTLAEPGGGELGIPVTPDAEFIDGLLRPRDFVGRRLAIDLTVLAACSSGRSGSDPSGVGTLSGALLAAGSQAVVATLWDVDDAASAVLMEQFYFELERGRPPGIALARAKARLRQDPHWSSPSHWAGFVLIGDSGPLRERQPWLGLAAAALVLLAVAVWLRRRAGD